MSESPSQAADRARSNPDSSVTPLGSVDVGNNSGALTVTLPSQPARGIGVDQGVEMHVGYDAETCTFLYRPAWAFDGWD